MKEAKHIFLGFSAIFLTSCKSLPEPIERTRTIKFSEQKKRDVIFPTLISSLDSNYALKFVVRYFKEPISEIVAEQTNELDNRVLEMEKSLLRNSFRVIDRPVYYDLKENGSIESYPFDYILELTDVQKTRHYTGIILYKNLEHFLEGQILTAKIIDPKTGSVVGLIGAEYVPCTKGCKITYDQFEIISIVDRLEEVSNKNSGNKGEFSEGSLEQLCNQICEIIRKSSKT